MRICLFEHEDIDLALNIVQWAEKRGFSLDRTAVHKSPMLPALDSFDWLIVVGGTQHVWEEDKHPWLPSEKRFIAEALKAGKIYLGICFGAQLLAEALGGKVFPNRHEEIGWHSVSLTQAGRKSFLFKGVPDRFTTFEWHSDHFSLPDHCTQLACNVSAANQAFISRVYRAAGIQFHPDCSLSVIKYLCETYGHEWIPGPYVNTPEEALAEADRQPETRWLMDALLDNMLAWPEVQVV